MIFASHWQLIKQKVPIAMIMKQYSHVSIEMTAHYLTLQEEEVKEIYSDMILSPESKIAGLRAKEIKGKLNDLFHGKTEAEIEDVITDLAKTMSFNPLPTGVCLYDFNGISGKSKSVSCIRSFKDKKKDFRKRPGSFSSRTWMYGNEPCVWCPGR